MEKMIESARELYIKSHQEPEMPGKKRAEVEVHNNAIREASRAAIANVKKLGQALLAKVEEVERSKTGEILYASQTQHEAEMFWREAWRLDFKEVTRSHHKKSPLRRTRRSTSTRSSTRTPAADGLPRRSRASTTAWRSTRGHSSNLFVPCLGRRRTRQACSWCGRICCSPRASPAGATAVGSQAATRQGHCTICCRVHRRRG